MHFMEAFLAQDQKRIPPIHKIMINNVPEEESELLKDFMTECIPNRLREFCLDPAGDIVDKPYAFYKSPCEKIMTRVSERIHLSGFHLSAEDFSNILYSGRTVKTVCVTRSTIETEGLKLRDAKST